MVNSEATALHQQQFDEMEDVVNELNAFEKFLSRSKILSPERIAPHLTKVRFYFKLLKIFRRADNLVSDLRELKDEINNMPQFPDQRFLILLINRHI